MRIPNVCGNLYKQSNILQVRDVAGVCGLRLCWLYQLGEHRHSKKKAPPGPYADDLYRNTFTDLAFGRFGFFPLDMSCALLRCTAWESVCWKITKLCPHYNVVLTGFFHCLQLSSCFLTRW